MFRFQSKRDFLFSRYWRRDQDGSYCEHFLPKDIEVVHFIKKWSHWNFFSGYGGFVHKSCTICRLFQVLYLSFAVSIYNACAFDKFLSLTGGLCFLIAAITQISVTHKARPLKSGYQRVDLSRTSQS
jgi:hypothetical protein